MPVPPRNRRSLRSALAAGVLVAVLAGALAVGAAALVSARAGMSGLVLQDHAERAAALAQAIDDRFHNRRTLLQVMAQGLRDAEIADGPRSQQWLTARPALLDLFDNVSIVGRDGALLGNARYRPNSAGVNVADRPYFIETLRTGRGVISSPVVSRVSGTPQVLLTQPVLLADGSLPTMLVGVIGLAESNALGSVVATRFGTTGYVAVTTADGLVVAHPDRKQILQRTDAVLPGDWLTRQEAVFISGDMLVARHRAQETDWTVFAAYPTAEAFAPIDRLRSAVVTGAVVLALVASAAALLWLRWLLAPLAALHERMRAFRGDGGDAPAPPNEIDAMARTFDELMAQRDAAERQLAAQARTDTLTQLPNRLAVYEEIPRIHGRAQRSGKPYAVLFLDIDRFKHINDTWGHPAGDAVLQQFGERLRSAVRSTDLVARLAGDEFVVVLEHPGDAKGAAQVAAKIAAAVAARDFHHKDTPIPVSTSVGTHMPSLALASDAEAALGRADEALYQVKAQRRGAAA